jgi:hypothetical protein
MKSRKVKFVVFVPESHADTVREVLGQAGAGKIGNYSFCSFSTKGHGRYIPGPDAHPGIGAIGQFEKVDEERIEVVCDREKVRLIVAAVKKVHPYEEVAFDVYPLETL